MDERCTCRRYVRVERRRRAPPLCIRRVCAGARVSLMQWQKIGVREGATCVVRPGATCAWAVRVRFVAGGEQE
eukprot:2544998-Prymnesium_polylepis.1